MMVPARVSLLPDELRPQ